MPETADTELQFPANFLKSFEISIQRRQNFSISCNNLVKLAMSFSTHLFHPITLSVCTERSLTGTGNKMVDVWQEDGKHRQKHPRFVRKGRCRNDRDGKRERTSGMSGRAARLCHRRNMGERWGLAGMYRWDATSFADGAWHTGAGGRSVWKTVKCWSIMS